MVRWQTWQARRFEIFESTRHCRIEQNLEASHVPMKKLHTLLVSLYFQRSLRYRGRKGQKWSEIRFFFSNFWPILWNPFARVDGSMPECAQVCALHMRLQSTALGDAKENRNGRRRGPPTPKRGEDTSGTRVRLHANFGVNRPAGCREIVDRTNKQTYSKPNTSPFALTSEWRVKKQKNTVKQIPRMRMAGLCQFY